MNNNILLFISLLSMQEYYLCLGKENCPNCSNSRDCMVECAGGCVMVPFLPLTAWGHTSWRNCKRICEDLPDIATDIGLGAFIDGLTISDEICPVRQSRVCFCCVERICSAKTPPLPQDYYKNFDDNIIIMANQIISLQEYLLIITCSLFITIISVCCIGCNIMKKKKYQKIINHDDDEEQEQEKLKV